MYEYLVTTALAVGGALFLHMFFRVVETSWPGSYYSVGDYTAYKVSANPVRFGLFRFGPIVVVTAFVAALAREVGGASGVSALAVGSIHAGFTHGRTAVSVARASRRMFARKARFLAHLGLTIGIVAASILGWLASRLASVRALLPPPEVLVTSLWTALFAGTIGAYLVRVSSRPDVGMDDLLLRSRKTLADGLLEHARDAALRADTDPELVQAIMLVENIQRPPWIRKLERLLGGAWGQRTQGVMQVKSSRPLSDTESIDLAIERHLSGVQIPQGKNGPGYEALRRVIRSYNGSESYADMVTDVYFRLRETENAPLDKEQ